MQIAENKKIELSFFTPEIMKKLQNISGIKSIFWNEAFRYYNQNHEIKLHKGCGSCYPKVYFFIKKQLDANS